jgi:undecaprenyl-diphosphatase
MNIFDAVILGIVEGLTEFLPVSSTGHLILSAKLLGLPVTDFLTSFEVVIQLGAILAVVTLYFKRFLLNWTMNMKLVLALLPSIVVGAFFYHAIKGLFGAPVVVAVSLVLGGIAILIIEHFLQDRPTHTEAVEDITWKEALYIGLFQTLAVIPGVSRAGATIMGGLLLGLKRRSVVEFSFLLAVPTMVAASAKDLLESSWTFTGNDIALLATGFITAYVVAMLVITFLLRFVQTHTFTAFGWYRIAVGLLFLLFIL